MASLKTSRRALLKSFDRWACLWLRPKSLNLRPASDALLADLSAETSETIREEASVLRREMAEREAQRTREQATREKKLEAEARRDRESYEAQTQLELEQQRALLIERQRAVKLEQLENEAVLKEREKAKAHEQALRDEAASPFVSRKAASSALK
jgi:hypothetical protein